MSSVYSPAPIRLGDITLVDDGDPKTAAGINTPIEAVADGVEFLNEHVDAAESNIDTLETRADLTAILTLPIVATSIGDMKDAAFDVANRHWYVVGGTENVRRSTDMGLSWSASSEVASVGSDEDCFAIDVDLTGNVVVATNTRYAFEKTGATSVWTRVDVSGSGSGAQPGAVAFDPIRSKWALLYNTSSGGAGIYTSSNRTSWSLIPRDGYGDFARLYTVVRIAANKTTGRLVAVGVTSGTVSVMTSDDGGDTWTERDDFAVGFTAESLSLSPAQSGTWHLTAGRSTGGYRSEVWSSTDDGASFARLSTLTASQIFRVARLRGALVATANVTTPDGTQIRDVVYSLDGGVTWRPSQHIRGAGTGGAYAGDGGVLIVSNLYVHHSVRVDDPEWTVLT